MAIAVPRQGQNGAARAPVPELEHEELVVRRGARSGAEIAVAIHSTALGPALGGVRLWHYETAFEAVADALRLAKGMTYKAAAAGLNLGGGKGVVCLPDTNGAQRAELRRDILLDFGDLVESLGGRYITAEDVGAAAEDMVTIAERTAHVTGLPVERGGSGDPSSFTALGVEAAMRACAAQVWGSRDLAGLRVVIVGLGHVGGHLAARLNGAGAKLAVSDINPEKRALAEQLGARWVEADVALAEECDVLAPCALGGAIDAATAGHLRCGAVCGAANNQLADESLAEVLAMDGILYAPDFIVNAGGLINIYREIRGYEEDAARKLVLGIEATMTRVLGGSAETGDTPLDAARRLAEGRLAVAEGHPVAA